MASQAWLGFPIPASLVALALFFVVRAYNRMNRDEAGEPEPEADPDDVVLLREIRDTLRAQPATPTETGPEPSF